MAKFDYLFEGTAAQQLELNSLVRAKLREAKRLLIHVNRQTAQDNQIIATLDLIEELAAAFVVANKNGYLSSGLHLLRLCQEATHRLFAIRAHPDWAEENTLPHAKVRQALREAGYPDWAQFYGVLSSVSHLNKRFILGIYPQIRLEPNPNSTTELFVEYYLMILNHFLVRALLEAYNLVSPHVGGDASILKQEYHKIAALSQADWERLHSRQNEVFGDEE